MMNPPSGSITLGIPDQDLSSLSITNTGTLTLDNIWGDSNTANTYTISTQSSTVPLLAGSTVPLITSTYNWSDSIGSVDTNSSPSLAVRGDAKIEGKLMLGNKDIGEVLDKIEQRLAILKPNTNLEEKWEKLKSLGDEYRALEQEIIEQEKIYSILKK